MNRHLDIITPFEFEGYLLLALDGKWKSILGKVIVFDVFIDKQRLHIISK